MRSLLPRGRRRPARVVFALAAVAVPLALAAPAHATDPSVNPQHWYLADGSLHGADGRCAPATDRTFTGTILGADGLGANVTLGFDMQDANGHTIDLATGCAAKGYSTIVQVNHDVGFAGAPVGSTTTPSSFAATNVVTDTYTIKGIPANITGTWIETYVRSADGSPCGWNCGGPLNTTKYGEVNRRDVPISTGGTNITLPLTTQYGGKTGTIHVVARNGKGKLVPMTQVHAWSMLPVDGSRSDQGWGNGRAISTGVVDVPDLASGQDYVVHATVGGKTFDIKHIPVTTGHTATYVIDTDGPTYLDQKALPASRVSVKRAGKQAFICAESARGLHFTLRCKAPRVPVHAIPTLSHFAYGKWIASNRTRVQSDHTFTLYGSGKFTGTVNWRLDVAGERDGFTVVSA